ncbi:MAG: HNH endonuclease [Flavobacteriales bacterium]|nr:HNH endonuclease [Flavobacteriales bacterium]
MTVLSIAQDTYSVGSTEYYYNRTYSTTGLPMVKRSEANRAAFLRSQGYASVPIGYEVDHIIPLSQGGTDDPSNMQLLTIEEHDRKTAQERARSTSTTYRSVPSYRSSYSPTPRYTTPTSYGTPNRTIQTGPRGGQYYINRNGNKTYIRKK